MNAQFYVGLELVAGVVMLGTAVLYAWRPSDRKLALLRPLSLGTLFAALAATANGAVIILNGASATPSINGPAAERLLAGSAEAVVPLVAGFTMLAVAWTCASFGMFRASQA